MEKRITLSIQKGCGRIFAILKNGTSCGKTLMHGLKMNLAGNLTDNRRFHNFLAGNKN
jgi:hypothetical protein